MSESNGQVVGVTSYYETGPDGQLILQTGQTVERRRAERPRRTITGYRERRMVRGAGMVAGEMMATLRQATERRIEETQDLSTFRRSRQPIDQYDAELILEAQEDCNEASRNVVLGLSEAFNARMRKWAER